VKNTLGARDDHDAVWRTSRLRGRLHVPQFARGFLVLAGHEVLAAIVESLRLPRPEPEIGYYTISSLYTYLSASVASPPVQRRPDSMASGRLQTSAPAARYESARSGGLRTRPGKPLRTLV